MELRDGQIVIGSWAKDDAPAVYAACQDREIQRWIAEIPRPYTLEHAREFVDAADGFAIRENGELIGSISLRVTAHNAAGIGYWCAMRRGRQGSQSAAWSSTNPDERSALGRAGASVRARSAFR